MLKQPLHSRLNREISLPLAPLLDIIFIVLFFFLLNTKPVVATTEHINLALPKSSSSNGYAPGNSVVVTIGKNELKINESIVNIDNFVISFNEIIKDKEDTTVLIVGDKDISYNNLIQIIGFVKQNTQVNNIALAVEEE
jgi:biopolymer transport protein ExbD